MCEHEITMKVENGMIITYCKKCGKILDTKTNESPKVNWSEAGFKNNGGQILHD